MIAGKKPLCQKQLDLSSYFDTIPACDKHTTTAYTELDASVALRGKKILTVNPNHNTNNALSNWALTPNTH